MLLGAANRDPGRWRDPDASDLSRDPSGRVGCGMGPHQCAGQHDLAGPRKRHHNNTPRAWDPRPARVRSA